MTSYLVARYPLLSDLQFGTGGVRDAPLPGLGLLLAAANKCEPGACCFVFPRSSSITSATAVIGALTRLKSDFPRRVEDFARRGFTRGQRVSVLPTGHVYEFDGVFEDPSDRFSRPRFRLKVIRVHRRVREYGPHLESAVRSFPVDEALRLRPTDEDARPFGKENTDLGEWTESALDQLIGIRSGGNFGLFGNYALMLAYHVDTERFAESITLGSDRSADETLDHLLTWGRIGDGGMLEPGERGAVDEEPLIAVTHTVDQLAEACEESEVCSKLVLVDGVTALTRNLQAFDRIAARQRVIIIADHEDEDRLDELAARGCVIWKLTAAEILGRTRENAADSGQRRAISAASVFSDARRAAINCERLHLTTIPVACEELEQAAGAIATAEQSLPEEDDTLGRSVGRAFGALLQVSAWFTRPSKEELIGLQAGMTRLGQAILSHETWAPLEYSSALRLAIRLLNNYAGSAAVGAARFAALLSTLDQLTAAHSYAIVTRTMSAANKIRALLSEYVAEPIVYGIAALPDDFDVDKLIITSWPTSALMRNVVGRYAAPDVQLLACPFEERWLRGMVATSTARERRWHIGLAEKKNLVDAPEGAVSSLGDRFPNGLTSRESSGMLDGDAKSRSAIERLEHWSQPRRKDMTTVDAPESDRRPARYVGFVGSTYAYLTPGRELPVVTGLLRGLLPKQARIPMNTVDHLKIGEYVLFRDSGDRDVIALLAEEMLGRDRYRKLREIAEKWKPVLRSIGTSQPEIFRQLTAVGLHKHAATVRSWLTDPDRIGPGAQPDLVAIALAARNDELAAEADMVWDAIQQLRGAHIGAGSRLSEILLAELPAKIGRSRDEETMVDLTFGHVWVVQIEEIGSLEERSYTEVNRLLWEAEGHLSRIPTPPSAMQDLSGGTQ